MNKINFVNSSQPALNSTNLNLLQNNIENEVESINNHLSSLDNKVKINTGFLKFDEDTETGATITLPISYKYGTNNLLVYLNGEKLIKCNNNVDETTGHYIEIKNTNGVSNQIKITSDWKIFTNDIIEIIVIGE